MYLLSGCVHLFFLLAREKCDWEEKNGTLYRISFEGKKSPEGMKESERIRHEVREKLEKAHYRSDG